MYCVIAAERGVQNPPRNYPPKDTSHYPGTVMLQTDQIQAGAIEGRTLGKGSQN
jgi:hypothetical protein